MLTRAQVQAILADVVLKHSEKLDAVAAVERREAGFDWREGRRADLMQAWVHQLLAVKGPAAVVEDLDQEAMVRDGLNARDVAEVNSMLDLMRRQKIVPASARRLGALLERHHIPSTAVNLAQVEEIYFRGLAASLFDVDRRWSTFASINRDHAGSILKIAEQAELANAIRASATDVHSDPSAPAGPPPAARNGSADRTSATYSTDASVSKQNSDSVGTVNDIHDTTASSAQSNNLGSADYDVPTEIVALSERLKREKKKTNKWNEKSQKQAKQTYDLLVRVVGITDIRHLSQRELGRFKDALLTLPTSYDKSSTGHGRPIQELLEEGLTLPDDEVGLQPKTINRHFTFINGLLRYAKSRGVKIDFTIDLSLLRIPIDSKEMDERIRFSTDEHRLIMTSPVWTGHASLKQRFEPGSVIVHDGLYWIPILGYYTGARREELCGLMIKEVVLDVEIPYLVIDSNTYRQVKNAQSRRHLPLHPEILRLGFAQYVKRIRELGYDLCFPDLLPGSTGAPLGDQFYDDFKKVLVELLPNHQAEGKSFHSFRHGFNIQLRKKKVFLEIREELMGHKIGSMSGDRYVEPFELQPKLETILQLENVTAKLSSHPVILLRSEIEAKMPVRLARARRGE